MNGAIRALSRWCRQLGALLAMLFATAAVAEDTPVIGYQDASAFLGSLGRAGVAQAATTTP